jgi:hypothetical protein
MADRLQVTELDFDSIKASLRNFLKQQSEFADYDFEGAGLSVLLDILAYNTHYNAYYLNMIANESFLDTALLRNSVVSHAKKMGYTPRSTKASKAIINIDVQTNTSNVGSLTIEAGQTFLSNMIDGRPYRFIVLDSVTVSKSNTNFVFTNVPIYEGELVSYNYTHNQASNPSQVFTLKDSNVDTSTLKVSVRPSSSNTQVTVYNRASEVISVSQTDPVYFLEEGREGNYQIYFGDDVIGKKLPDGAIVTATYLITNGDLPNGANNFTITNTISGYSNITVSPVVKASAGAMRETVDEIKYAAPLSLTSQNRAVTKNDYIRLIQQKYPAFEAVNVWGGEENVPPIFGKVFISAKPKLGFEVTQTEKDYVVNKIIKPLSVLTVTPEIVDVDYNYIKLVSKVYFDPAKTTSNQDSLKAGIKTTIEDYCDTNLNQFNTYFKSSGLKTTVDRYSNSIISNDLEVFVSKRFRPNLITSNNYKLDFGVELQRGTTYDNFYSSPAFTLLDEEGISRECLIEEIPSSFTGVESITVTNPGFNYTGTPTVEIVGDGEGATAVATVVNGRINSITVTSPGIGYTSTSIRIVGGGGQSAEAKAVLQGRYGQLRIVYYKTDDFTSQNTKVVINQNRNNGIAGTIDYLMGVVYLTDFNPTSVSELFGNISINIRPKASTIKSEKNKMLVLDESDPTSVVVEMIPVYASNIESM